MILLLKSVGQRTRYSRWSRSGVPYFMCRKPSLGYFTIVLGDNNAQKARQSFKQNRQVRVQIIVRKSSSRRQCRKIWTVKAEMAILMLSCGFVKACFISIINVFVDGNILYRQQCRWWKW